MSDNLKIIALCLLGAVSVAYIIFGDFEPKWWQVAVAVVVAAFVIAVIFHKLKGGENET